jgi:hypothetical protein
MDGAPITASSSNRPNPTTLWLTFPSNGSSAGPSSAAFINEYERAA